MSKSYVKIALRAIVREQAKNRCGYCLSDDDNSGIDLTIEHIIPESLGGATEENNLWLACYKCNEAKNDRTHAVDPVTKASVPLFNPRTQKWEEHFTWIEGGLYVEGKTPTGRATVVALKLNRDKIVNARTKWIKWGIHPPSDE
jgi:hypothetical protein